MDRLLLGTQMQMAERAAVLDAMFRARNVGIVVSGTGFGGRMSGAIGVFNDWFDASQIYRKWALNQHWARKGTLYNRTDIPQWFKDITYCHRQDTKAYLPETAADIAINLNSKLTGPMICQWYNWQENYTGAYEFPATPDALPGTCSDARPERPRPSPRGSLPIWHTAGPDRPPRRPIARIGPRIQSRGPVVAW